MCWLLVEENENNEIDNELSDGMNNQHDYIMELELLLEGYFEFRVFFLLTVNSRLMN